MPSGAGITPVATTTIPVRSRIDQRSISKNIDLENQFCSGEYTRIRKYKFVCAWNCKVPIKPFRILLSSSKKGRCFDKQFLCEKLAYSDKRSIP